ncbi:MULTISPECIES: LLM class flavin-dependent oxidoreductase [unclassified Streptomyces]|jgi:alkanesulfonate monooxygenase SsuD/methylene tetrahydromethanopterin reductase-like flavin-dependent oxidoreductase (luciferase family)|uniref:LLM class flavin-dependent oxidoreductase n=1 Tax=Streptomyces TaxID=1883 RepID=UPI00190A48E8|nr:MULTISPECIES: LLM class flavin-dependent oxidoreductase [unclassified Streptomyces]MBK3566675.1 LLM class flavin-dependent oxidoreductase [Streptomyces sp. MBT62]MBK6011772.1 LLM class flavin-dependent oxidoreductase [Streptomyces sp. MBT53]
MDYSVLVPFLPRRTEQVLPFAALVEWTGAARLWQGQSLLMEPFQTFSALAGSGFRVPTGLGVTLMPLRHPFEAAHKVKTLAMATGEEVVAGFGPGAKTFQQSLLGAPYRSQLTAVREYMTVVRGLLSGDPVDFDGEYYTCHAGMGPAMSPPVHLGLGVLRPGMARLAGEVADVAITWLTPAAYVDGVVRPALREGASAAGRAVPRITAMVPVALERPDRDVSDFVLASNAAHMQAPHYIDMLGKAGIDFTESDSKSAARLMAESGAFVFGNLDQIVKQLDEYRDAGVDEIVLNLTGVCRLYGASAAMDDLKQILAAVGADRRDSGE